MHLRNRSQKIELLKQVPLLASLSRRQLDEFAKHSDEVQVEAGTVLAKEGTVGRELFVLVSGTATVSRKGRKLATLGPGDFFGEMALLDNQPRSATVVAEEPLVLLVVGVREFKPLLTSVPNLAEGLLRAMASRLRAADEALTH